MTDRSRPAVFSRAADVNSTSLPDGDAVLLHLRSMRYYTLNATGEALWLKLESPQTVDELTVTLTERYAVSARDAQDSVETVLHDLVREGLVTRG